MADHGAGMVEPFRFSIGHVLELSWQGTARNFAAVSIACVTAGSAAVTLPIAIASLLPSMQSFVANPLTAELIQVATAMAVVIPALVLLARSHRGESVEFRAVASTSVRRVSVVVASQITMDFILVAPAYLLVPKLQLTGAASIAIFVLYEIPILAFNYILLTTLAAEPIGLHKALRRTFQLLSRQWWRMFGITLILWGASCVVVILAQYMAAPLDPFGWGLNLISALVFGIRLFMVVPVAVAAHYSLSLEKDGLSPQQAALVFD